MSKEEDVRSAGKRRRNILYLIERYLRDNGFYDTCECLKNEARLQNDYEICDNVDLDSIYLEYASFYQVKFGKNPKILKKLSPSVKIQVNNTARKCPATSRSKKEESPQKTEPFNESLQIKQISSSASNHETTVNPVEFGIQLNPSDLIIEGWKYLEECVKLTIVNKDLGFRWKDIFGNTKAVETIKEAVIMPLKYPQLFSDKLKPWKSLLLHGPPGGGKTLLARVLCSETQGQITFFNVTSSCVTSKWRGESEKIIKVLFYYAKMHAPAVIFLDEIDALTSGRDRASDHEASKRFKNEFLQLLDGLEDNNTSIFVLASTNIPWDIDPAFLRRFEKKILINLPSNDARYSMIEYYLQNSKTYTVDVMKELTKLSEGFTGDQIRLACKEAAMNQIRNISTQNPQTKQITIEDLRQAFKIIKPIDEKLVQKHTTWNNINGS
ncbi:katanin p60 ATPase-containing subunit A-like 2 [Episyrphus balteatus]|uniref:katanin p60 ATPase-containing subunit A-like 2 n=1 Tax=Episyrphus balteatus TaxID=286459 RepID=UPI002485C582|nr:katanin p60 ATPase-containing subunit A-like 2 [Episyrphus balteatus]